ncbi:MAG: phasin family protein [Janthinobacterium lividum]
MFLSQEQFSSATKTQFDTQLAYMHSLSSGIFDNLQKVAQLNLATAKTLFEESTAATRNMLAAKDFQEQINVLTTQSKQSPEKLFAYSRHLTAIVSGMHSDLSSKTENQVNTQGEKLTNFVDEISKNAPAGSENVISAVKSAINSSNRNYEKFNKGTRQMVDALEKNLNVASSQLVQNVAAQENQYSDATSTNN